MEKLSEIPIKEGAEQNPEDEILMDKYFGSGTTKKSKLTWTQIFKMAVYAALLFAILSNSYVDIGFKYIPYTEHPAALLAVKTLLYFILIVLISKFAVSN